MLKKYDDSEDRSGKRMAAAINRNLKKMNTIVSEGIPAVFPGRLP